VWVQSSLRDSNSIYGSPGVETSGCSREVPSGPCSSNRCQERGQPWPRERKSRDSRTKPSALLLYAAVTTLCLQLLYSPSAHAQGGVPLWTNRYDAETGGSQPSAIVVDRSGNVFVTGTTGRTGIGNEGDDYATIKYSNAGVPLWTNRYDGPVNGEDWPLASAVDGNGNVFVTGVSRVSSRLGTHDDYATIAYSNSGAPLWTNYYNGPPIATDLAHAIAVDTNGNVFVTGFSYNGTSDDDATIAYSNLGVPLWTNRYGGANGSGSAIGIAVDASGNVFVTGASLADPTLIDSSGFATVAYSNAGVPLWTNRYNGPANGPDYPSGIAVDTSGKVFVTGNSSGVNGVADYATIAYSSAGVPLWTNRYNGPDNGYDSPFAIAVDTSGNVFVTGVSAGADGLGDYATIAYSSAGVALWTRRYNSGDGNGASASAIAVDSSGNVFVTGNSGTIAYSSTGEPLWTNRTSGSFDSNMAVDSSGNVFVTGYSYNGTNAYILTVKYSSSVPPPHLDFQLLNSRLVLSWANDGFDLQTAPAITGPFTNLPGATSPYTNAVTFAQQFFRLSGN
jgi:Beta-propeller repeat